MARIYGSKNIGKEQQKAIVRGRQQGMTHEQLSRQFGVGKSTITKFLSRWQVQGDVQKKKNSGRPRVTSKLVDRNIVRLSRDNPRLTAVDITRELSIGNEVFPSIRTVRRRLQAAGLNGRRPVKKPLISAKNRKARVEFAKEHLEWTADQWKNIIWSDESKFSLFGSDGPAYVRRPIGTRFDPRYQLPTVKHGGGNVMVWGCFSAQGVGPLHRIDGIMNKEMYMSILEDVMLPFARDSFGRRFIFQQDNDPKHSAGAVKNWFNNHRVNVMKWPSQSPDLNPIENLWDELDRRLKNIKAKNANEKFQQLEEAWYQIPASVIENLINSMPRRCQAVIKAKGYATKY